VLHSLGFVRVFTSARAAGWGREGGGDQFAIKQKAQVSVPGTGFHLAFTAQSREAVNAFYQAALTHGGSDNGPPGLRPHYGDGYYAAFVRDPDGYEVEVVINQGFSFTSQP
jgi:catechol 2,3-dioxygenase-like lactoylglutathione lyase family enzyme